jgi:hypothetical protein
LRDLITNIGELLNALCSGASGLAYLRKVTTRLRNLVDALGGLLSSRLKARESKTRSRRR